MWFDVWISSQYPCACEKPGVAPGWQMPDPRVAQNLRVADQGAQMSRTCRGCAHQLVFHVNRVSCFCGSYKITCYYSFYIFKSSIVLILL